MTWKVGRVLVAEIVMKPSVALARPATDVVTTHESPEDEAET